MIYASSFPPTVIRRANTDDVEELYLLETICFRERRFKREHILWILHNPHAATFIDREEKTRGTLMLLIEGNVCRVLSLAVHPSCRLKGHGRQLRAVAERWAKENGATAVKLEVSTSNNGAIEFYRKLGYENAGLLSHYYSWGEDAYSMKKDIAQGAKT
jgi:ribosomal-protein-alanine N-acetyltransferase